jgi:hypothetical protein
MNSPTTHQRNGKGRKLKAGLKGLGVDYFVYDLRFKFI